MLDSFPASVCDRAALGQELVVPCPWRTLLGQFCQDRKFKVGVIRSSTFWTAWEAGFLTPIDILDLIIFIMLYYLYSKKCSKVAKWLPFHCPVSHGAFEEQSDKSCHYSLGYLPKNQPFGIWKEKSVSCEKWKAGERPRNLSHCFSFLETGWRLTHRLRISLGPPGWNQEEMLALNGSFWGEGLPDFENPIHF